MSFGALIFLGPNVETSEANENSIEPIRFHRFSTLEDFCFVVTNFEPILNVLHFRNSIRCGRNSLRSRFAFGFRRQDLFAENFLLFSVSQRRSSDSRRKEHSRCENFRIDQRNMENIDSNDFENPISHVSRRQKRISNRER